MLQRTTAMILGLGISATAAAHDDGDHHGPDHNQIDGVRVEIHGTVSPYNVLGVGARVEFPVVADGFVGGDVQDELALSLGADGLFAPLDRSYYDGGVYVVPIAAFQWNFYLGEDWSVFPEAGLAFFVFSDGNGWNGHGAVYAAPDLGIGARYHFASRNALLVRASTPGGLQVGLTF